MVSVLDLPRISLHLVPAGLPSPSPRTELATPALRLCGSGGKFEGACRVHSSEQSSPKINDQAHAPLHSKQQSSDLCTYKEHAFLRLPVIGVLTDA